ncbi:hypothetical protein K449DRAFT_88994 [Hypoxylon sp. EC38]|nr:hypothetical protein K449DRAFT_88994 [Hypoxylon sp. EC38]
MESLFNIPPFNLFGNGPKVTAGSHRRAYNKGNRNKIFQDGNDHDTSHKGDGNRTFQQGKHHDNMVDGNWNGTVQVGIQDKNKTNGNRNLSGQYGSYNENKVSGDNRTYYQSGTRLKSIGENEFQPHQAPRGDKTRLRKWLDGLSRGEWKSLLEWPLAWEWAWDWAKEARNHTETRK